VQYYENFAISPETSAAETHQFTADPAIHDDADSDAYPAFHFAKLNFDWYTSFFRYLQE
jgi:hypothetical protein